MFENIGVTGDFRCYEIFNQFVRILDAIVGWEDVMRSIDRISGSFLAIMFGGVALLCGSLLFATLGN